MTFLISHWYCILPIAVIVVAILFMGRDKPKDKNKENDNRYQQNDQINGGIQNEKR